MKTKIKEYLKNKECNTSSDLYEEVEKETKRLLDKAVKRCKTNHRQTVYARDF